MPLNTYLLSLSFTVLCQVKLFIIKLKSRVLRRKKLLKIEKRKVSVKFDASLVDDLVYTLFVMSQFDEGQKTYEHSIERIDNVRHVNEDYNPLICTRFRDGNPVVGDGQLEDIIKGEITRVKKRH